MVDTHIDLPMRLHEQLELEESVRENPALRTEGNFDYPRAKAGGLDAAFMSIYIPASYEDNGAMKLADELIDLVEKVVVQSQGKFAPALNPTQLEKNFAAGVLSMPLGMENGAPIEGKLENLRHFYDRGIRYITLAHSKDNHISDSSYDERHTHKGLTKFGRKVVAEMNRLGIMVDISHVSDDAFWQVLEISSVPVIASHSSCRHFTPGFERNMSDKMIQALAEKGGVIQINFGSGFLDAEVRAASTLRRESINSKLLAAELEPDSPEYKAARAPLEREYDEENERLLASVETVADHIDHVVQLAGIDHVGLGSDFDGVGDSLPEGLEDASTYPNLLAVLLERGYSEADIAKVCGENLLRVWSAVEAEGSKAR